MNVSKLGVNLSGLGINTDAAVQAALHWGSPHKRPTAAVIRASLHYAKAVVIQQL